MQSNQWKRASASKRMTDLGEFVATHSKTNSDVSGIAGFDPQDRGECARSSFIDLTQVVASRRQSDAKSHQHVQNILVSQLMGCPLQQVLVVALDAEVQQQAQTSMTTSSLLHHRPDQVCCHLYHNIS